MGLNRLLGKTLAHAAISMVLDLYPPSQTANKKRILKYFKVKQDL